MVDAVYNSVVSGTNPASAASAVSSSVTSGIADNFQTFLSLLTTQLKNQNPLDPLDTNQFTQQLVQFAGVEQQLKSNDQLKALVDLQKTAQATQALGFVGHTVAVDGSTAQFNGMATWNLLSEGPASATINIQNAQGQTVYSGNFSMTDGASSFVWDGKGNDGTQWPPGDYKLVATGLNKEGKPVAISTEVQGRVDSVDMTQTPALLTISGRTYTLDQIKRIVADAPKSPAPDPAPETDPKPDPAKSV